MEESKYTKEVLERFNSEFSEGWIDSLNWNEKVGKKALYTKNLLKLESFRIFIVENYAMMALSGDQLLFETNDIDRFQYCISFSLDECVFTDKSLKSQLHNKFQALLIDLNEIVLLAKKHIYFTINHFSIKNEYDNTFDIVSYSCFREDRDTKVSLLDWIFDVCALEYVFSYEDDYIRALLRYRKSLQDESSKYNGTLALIIKSCISKIELLIEKLSAFSKDKQIIYNCNFKSEIFKLDGPNVYSQDDYRHLYLKFLNPSLIDCKTIKEWSKDSKKKVIKMWQLAFLMRYHVKCTKNERLINDLIRIVDYHHNDYNDKDDHNIVNDYSDESFLNYMYNSRFSFMCQHSKAYSYALMKQDLSKIKSIQEETSIFNYHPYQKAIEFTLRCIEQKIKESQNTENLDALVDDLQDYFKKMKDNVNWCKHHQPYLMQLRYNFSCIQTEIDGLKMFCPSSICRPLQFHKLREWINKYAAKIAIIEYEAKHQADKKELNDAKKKIELMDRKNLEHLGLFASIITFFVGLLSIFIGNNGHVSLFQRMEYVIALGLILVIFICLGYFVIGSSLQKVKPWIFGGTLLGCLISMFFLLNRAPSVDFKSEEVKTSDKIDTVNIAVDQIPILNKEKTNKINQSKTK